MATQGLGVSEQEGHWAKVAVVFLPDLDKFTADAFQPSKFANFANYAQDIIPVQPDGVTLFLNTPGLDALPGSLPPGPADSTYPAFQNVNLPNSGGPSASFANTKSGRVYVSGGGSRGSWMGALFVQTLQAQGQPPDLPPANALVSNTPGYG